MDSSIRKTELFTKKDLNKLIRPLVLEQLLAISVGMFDTMMISSLGDNAVSGVSLVDMINVLMINIFAALATGGAVVCAHEVGLARVSKGEQDFSKARDSAKQLMFVLFVVSCAVAAVCFFLRGQILGLLYSGDPGMPDVYGMASVDHAKIYFAISTLSYPFIALYNGFAALFRTMGNSRITMIVSVIVNIVNVVGNALLIYVFDQRVAGAAWSTTVSRMLGMVILAVLITNKKRIIYIDFRERLKPRLETVKKILRIGVPGGLENSVFNLGRIITISMMTSFGAEQLSANAVANNLDSLGCVPGQAVGLAVVTVVGQCIGAGDLDAAYSYAKKLMKTAYLYMGIIGTAILVSLPLTLRLYSASREALEIAALLVLIHVGIGMLIWPLSFVTPHILRSAKDVRYTMVIAISSMFTFRLFLSYIIGVRLGMGVIGVWMAMIVDWIFRSVMFVYRIKSGRWLSKVKGDER